MTPPRRREPARDAGLPTPRRRGQGHSSAAREMKTTPASEPPRATGPPTHASADARGRDGSLVAAVLTVIRRKKPTDDAQLKRS